uniref:Small G protein signaling modulator 2 (inferred by orthology to a human protein) n=1 Tax=Strongyloides venezuelensis TaxID=75913 RepID=A0A0K0G1M0_STRVS
MTSSYTSINGEWENHHEKDNEFSNESSGVSTFKKNDNFDKEIEPLTKDEKNDLLEENVNVIEEKSSFTGEYENSLSSTVTVSSPGNHSTSNTKNNKTLKSCKRPPLSMIRTRGSVIKSADSFINTSSPSGREFVYSLHQNNKLTLLYGKNNVSISTFDDNKMLKGYLSLHKEFSGYIIVKWTPNELMNLNNSQSTTGTSTSNSSSSLTQTTTAFPFTSSSHPIDILVLTKHIISFNMKNIAYIHVHQNDEMGISTVVFVDTDGSQQASFSFMNSKNLIQFIGTLETCLNPFFKLDPPMFENKETQEKSLPKLKKKTSNSTSKASSVNSEDEGKQNQVNDYVFRIVINSQMKNKLPDKSSDKIKHQHTAFSFSIPSNNNNLSNFRSFEIPKSAPAFIPNENLANVNESHENSLPSGSDNKIDTSEDNVTANISNALIFMKQHILSRAFLGWLNYCKHIKTVRKYLLGIVNDKPIKWYDEEDVTDNNIITKEYWKYLRDNKNDNSLWEIFIGKVYHYGIANDVRKEAWLYLLKVLSWEEEIEDKIEIFKENYNKDKLNWLEIENVVIQRDKEAFISARLRHFNGSGVHDDDDSECTSINSHQYECTSFEEAFGDEIVSGGYKGRNHIYEDSQSNDKNQEEEDLINNFGTNLHRIEKDVERCDRSNQFFKKSANLKKLKRIMCSYVWRNLEEGYVQGMCDIAAPLLVIFDDEVIVLECFSKLMERMRLNFPQEIGMDNNFLYLRHLVEVTDPELFSMIMAHGDFTHLYFSYRWFLLDFKRELNYDGVYRLWEIIWASNIGGLSKYFQLFFALSLLTANRYIIIENAMDFTDVIKFFNDMAEKHDTQKLIDIARAHLKDFRKFTIDNCTSYQEKE